MYEIDLFPIARKLIQVELPIGPIDLFNEVFRSARASNQEVIRKVIRQAAGLVDEGNENEPIVFDAGGNRYKWVQGYEDPDTQLKPRDQKLGIGSSGQNFKISSKNDETIYDFYIFCNRAQFQCAMVPLRYFILPANEVESRAVNDKVSRDAMLELTSWETVTIA